MPPIRNTLFNGKIEAGVAPGSHVVHIINQNGATNGVAIPIDDEFERSENVSQVDAYSNPSDIEYGNRILKLAEHLRKDYKETDNPDFKNYYEKWADYLTADSRSKQQEALREVNKASMEIRDKYKENYDEKSPEGMFFTKFNSHYEKHLNEMTDGSLWNHNIPDKSQVTEPKSVGISGFFSAWVDRSADHLFPHEPSPNDIKQGVGLEDCYMLSALTQIAAKNPQKIKDAMRDNGNGTVTVRFYYNGEPKDIDVRKTESKVMGFGMHSYSSGSLWVQMMEKAYAKYNDFVREQNGKEPLGMSGIDRGFTHNFMNAFDKDASYESTPDSFGFGRFSSYSDDYKKKRDSYNIQENAFYSMLKYKTDQKGEVITVGNQATGSKKREVKSHGIRTGHAYTVLGAFEKDGKKYISLRDPYAVFSSGYDKSGKLVNTGSPISGTINAGAENMGTFNMEVSDFMNHFSAFSGIQKDTNAQLNGLIGFAEGAKIDPASKDNLFKMISDPEITDDEKDMLFEKIGDFQKTYGKNNERAFITDFMNKYCDPEASKETQASLIQNYENGISEAREKDEAEKLAKQEEAKKKKENPQKDISIEKDEEKEISDEWDMGDDFDEVKPEEIGNINKSEKKDDIKKPAEAESVKEEAEKDDLMNEFEVVEPENEGLEESNELDTAFDNGHKAILSDETKDFINQMKDYSKKLHDARSFWRNSDKYDALEKAVKEATKCTDGSLKEAKDKIAEAAQAYLDHKAIDGTDKKSQKKVDLANELKDMTPEAKKEKSNVKVSDPSMRELTNLNKLTKEEKPNAKEIGQTSKQTVVEETLSKEWVIE